jgi:hypothetical protein
MTPKIKPSDLRRTRARGGLARPVHLTIRLTMLEYEFIVRKCENKVVAGEVRKQWFNNGWEKELEALRKDQRKRGISDVDFMHPSLRLELYKKQQKR